MHMKTRKLQPRLCCSLQNTFYAFEPKNAQLVIAASA